MDIDEKLINQMIEKEYLKVPEVCSCGNKKINLNKLKSNKNTKFCLRCTKYNCKKIYPLRENSLFSKFKYNKFKECFEILKCFIDFKFNVNEAFNYSNNTAHLNINKRNISNFYYEIRKVIYEYYVIEYNSEEFGTLKGNRYYSVDESLFTHNLNGEKFMGFRFKR